MLHQLPHKLLSGMALVVFFLGIQAFASAQAATDLPFTATLEELSVSPTQAGAPAELNLRMKRTAQEHCLKLKTPSSTSLGGCEVFYLEQHLKRMKITMPPGFTPDPQAAPYCGAKFFDGTTSKTVSGWFCTNPEARVGSVVIAATICDEWSFFGLFNGCFKASGDNLEPQFEVPPGIGMFEPGIVYNEKPGPNEQGRLVILWPKLDDFPGIKTASELTVSSAALIKSDVSITYDESTGELIADADDIPDIAGLVPGFPVFPAAVTDLKMTLDGDTGAENGHPLLTNSSFCTPQSFDVMFQGYLVSSKIHPDVDAIVGATGVYPETLPGHGNGKIVNASAPYQSTGCDLVPYAPKLDFTLDNKTPGSVPGISTTITQASPASPQFVDELTTSKVEVNFPKGFGINIKSKVSPCSKSAVAEGTCPATAKLGTMSAQSRLLPPGESLNGDVYLTKAQGTSFGISAQLTGMLQPGTKPIKLVINGKAKVFANGGIKVVFADLPALPIKKFDLSLSGGINQGLIKNPQICGNYAVKSAFTSHSGRVVNASQAVKIAGCDEPSFDVEITENDAGKKTTIELDVTSPGKPISKLSFGLDRGYRPSLKGLGKRRKVATITVQSGSGLKQVSLKRSKSKKKAKKALKLTGGSTLGDLSANIFRKRFARATTKVFKRSKNKKNKKLKTKTVVKNRLTLKSLPQDDVTRVSVSFNPDEIAYLKNPRCNRKRKRKVNFIAFITTTDGKRHAISHKLKLRCGKRSKSS